MMGDIHAIDRALVARAEATVGILMDWADWQRGFFPNIGFRSRSVGMSSGYVSKSFDDMFDAVAVEGFKVVDTCIDELNPASYKAAIMHRYLGHAVQLRDYEDSLLKAHEELMKAFVRKGVMF